MKELSQEDREALDGSPEKRREAALAMFTCLDEISVARGELN